MAILSGTEQRIEADAVKDLHLDGVRMTLVEELGFDAALDQPLSYRLDIGKETGPDQGYFPPVLHEIVSRRAAV